MLNCPEWIWIWFIVRDRNLQIFRFRPTPHVLHLSGNDDMAPYISFVYTQKICIYVHKIYSRYTEIDRRTLRGNVIWHRPLCIKVNTYLHKIYSRYTEIDRRTLRFTELLARAEIGKVRLKSRISNNITEHTQAQTPIDAKADLNLQEARRSKSPRRRRWKSV